MEKIASRLIMRTGLILTMAGLFLVMSVSLFAAEEWMVFSTENTGLPNNDVTALSLDDNGELMVGTGLGCVTKYNGLQWEVLVEPTGNADDNIRSFIKDQQGVLWLGKTGLERFDGQTSVIYHNDSSGLPGDIVRSILPAPDDKLWIGTSGGLVLYDKRINWNPLFTAENSPIPNNQIRDLIYDANGNLWAATEGGVARFDGQNWLTYTAANSGLSNNQTRAILFDADHTMWVATSGGGLNKFDGTDWTLFEADSSDLPHNKVRDLAFDAQGKLWMTTDNGLACLQNDVFTVYNTTNSTLPVDMLKSLLIDNDGTIWMGSEIGLVEFDGVDFALHTKRNTEMPNNEINVISFDSEGTAWIGTRDGLTLYNGTFWKVLNSNNTIFPDDDIRGIDMDSQGNMWLATYGGGLLKYDGIDWLLYTPLNPNDGITGLMVDNADVVWISIEGAGVLSFDGSIGIPYNKAIGNIASDLILDFAPGSVYMATQDAGLLLFDGTDWTVYDLYTTDLPDRRIPCVVNDGNGTLWMGVFNNGLAKFSNGTDWDFFNKEDSGLNNNYVNDVDVDSQGDVWLATGAETSINSGGLTKFDGTNWSILNWQTTPLPANNIELVSVDAHDNKWVSVGGLGLAIYNAGGIIFKVNTAPVANDDQASVNQGESVVIPVLGNDSDPDGDALTITGVTTTNITGDVTINTNDGTLTYTAPADFSGQDIFEYTVCDGNGGSATATVTVEVKGSSAVLSLLIPAQYELSQNYPNPFNPLTKIQYALPQSGHVEIKVFDMNGREIAEILNENVQAGYHAIAWDASALPSGLYVYSIQSGSFNSQKKMMLIK